jgi:hypothetical protein
VANAFTSQQITLNAETAELAEKNSKDFFSALRELCVQTSLFTGLNVSAA